MAPLLGFHQEKEHWHGDVVYRVRGIYSIYMYLLNLNINQYFARQPLIPGKLPPAGRIRGVK